VVPVYRNHYHHPPPQSTHQLPHIHRSKVARIKHIPHLIILLLQRPRRREPLQQTRTARLVTSAARPAPTKALLPNHRGSDLAIDIEIASSISQPVLGLSDSFLIVGENISRQSETATLTIDLVQDLGKLGVRVDVSGEDGAEELGVEDRVRGVSG
jgi:hypothetical protein